jgi:Ni/Co efflux regulator RcnB
MKKLILSAIAATLIASPMAIATAEAAPVQRERTVTTVKERPNGRTVVTQRTTVRNRTTVRDNGAYNWRAGQRFDRRRATNYRVVRDYRTYRLAAPGRGQYWARSGNDAILVRNNGTVVRVIQRSFR